MRREVEVLRRLRGCLNVAALEDVFEDDTHVHMVLEYCKGGELHHHIGDTVYSGGQHWPHAAVRSASAVAAQRAREGLMERVDGKKHDKASLCAS